MQALPGSSMSGGVGVARAQHFHQQRSANDERVYDPQRELQQNISRQIGQLIHSLVVHSSYLWYVLIITPLADDPRDL